MGIGEACSTSFTESTACHETKKMLHVMLVMSLTQPGGHPLLQVFVDHKVSHSFEDPIEGSSEAEIESPDPALLSNLPDHISQAGRFFLPVQLQSGLHHPDRVGCDGADAAGKGGRGEVDQGGVPLAQDIGKCPALAVGVSPEVDCSRRCNSHQIGSETPEKTWDSLLNEDLS